MRGGAGGALLEACDIASNGGNGVLARDSARPRVLACSIRGNAGYGVLLKDGTGEFAGNTIAGGSWSTVPWHATWPKLVLVRAACNSGDTNTPAKLLTPQQERVG